MTDFTIPPTVTPHLPDYGDLDYGLPTINSEFSRGDASAEEIETAYSNLNAEARHWFDVTILAICGWSVQTLMAKAKHASVDWVEIMFQEIASDDVNPFKETGVIMSDWESAPKQAREDADAVYVMISGRTLTAQLEEICDSIANFSEQ